MFLCSRSGSCSHFWDFDISNRALGLGTGLWDSSFEGRGCVHVCIDIYILGVFHTVSEEEKLFTKVVEMHTYSVGWNV
jgi:hypothetical protein